MGVEGGEVSLTKYGRTRDLLFRLIFNGSDVPAGEQAGHLLFLSAGRGSPPMDDWSKSFLMHSIIKHERKHDKIEWTEYLGGFIY
jgi:hypothetical protein